MGERSDWDTFWVAVSWSFKNRLVGNVITRWGQSIDIALWDDKFRILFQWDFLAGEWYSDHAGVEIIPLDENQEKQAMTMPDFLDLLFRVSKLPSDRVWVETGWRVDAWARAVRGIL